MKKNKDQKVSVGVTMPTSELKEMKRITCIDLNGTAVLALARKGLDHEKKRIAEDSRK